MPEENSLFYIVIFIEKQSGFGRYESHFQAGYCRVGQLLNFTVVTCVREAGRQIPPSPAEGSGVTSG